MRRWYNDNSWLADLADLNWNHRFVTTGTRVTLRHVQDTMDRQAGHASDARQSRDHHHHRERDTMDNNMHDDEDTILYVDLPAGTDIEAAVGRPQEILRGYLVDPDNGDGYSPITHSTYRGPDNAYQDLTRREIARMWIDMEAERRDIPAAELIAVVWRFPWT